MKDSDLHRLLKYDQSSEHTPHQDYFCRLPTTLLYPQVTRTDIEAYIETIEREYLTPLDLHTWQQLQLFLLEPEWLQSSAPTKTPHLDSTNNYKAINILYSTSLNNTVISRYSLRARKNKKHSSLPYVAYYKSLNKLNNYSIRSYSLKMLYYKISNRPQQTGMHSSKVPIGS